MHRTIDVIDGKYINIGIGEPVEIDGKPVVTMQDVEFTKKMYELKGKNSISKDIQWGFGSWISTSKDRLFYVEIFKR